MKNSGQGTSAFSSNVVSIPNESARLIIQQPVHEWRKVVAARLECLMRLPTGWDGYCGQPVTFLNANFALQLLDYVCGANVPAPQIVPGAEGDLQIEWHTLTGDIELHVLLPFRVHAWRAMVGGESDGEHRTLTNDFTVVAAWVKDVTETPLATTAAAA